MTDTAPIANAATGPGGLFSNPALGSLNVVRRRSKSAQRRAEKAQYKAMIAPDAHPGAMIALMLSPEQQALITANLPGRLAKEADHCTLLYLAEEAATIRERKPALLSALAALAQMTAPIEVALNGYGAFGGNETEYPLVLLLNSPQLPWLRHSLYLQAEGAGIPLEDRYGFTPHITLTYLPTGTPVPRLERQTTPLRFEAISLIWAGERIDLPLLGEPVRATKADDTYSPPEAARNNARRGLELRRKWGRGGTAVGVARARDLANDKSLPYRTVARMAAFNRHRANALDGRTMPDGGPSAAHIAWLLWGGTSGVDWARGITGASKREKAPVAPAYTPGRGAAIDDTATGGKRLKTALSASEGITTKPFASRAQQRWAFSTGQPFAERWADETGSTAAFRNLPEKVARKSKSAVRRLGLLDPDELARSEKAGERIAGQLCRSATGKFVNCNSAQATQESKDKLKKQASDQKKQLTAAERAAKRRENEAAVGEQAGLGKDLSDALLEFASPDEDITLAPQNAEAMLAKGLIEQNPDGSYRISGAGRSYIAAARTGDVSKARDALGRADERAARRREVAERRAAREAERNAPEAGEGDLLDPKEAKPKKGGGGGGGGGKDDKEAKPSKISAESLRRIMPSGNAKPASGGGSSGGRKPDTPKEARPAPEDRATQRDQERTRTAIETAQRTGLRRGDYDALRSAAEGAGGNRTLDTLGFTSGGEATDQGRRALSALERGDLRAYQAAAQDARARIDRRREKTLGDLLIALKHGSHNQASHGRRGRAGRAGKAAYSSARAGGASHGEALAAQKQTTAAERTKEKQERSEARTARLQTQAQRARQAANSGQVTDAQRARLIDKADRLDARARGETVGPRQSAAKPANANGDTTKAYGANPNQSYALQHRVVDMADLKASNLPNGAVNPAYDPRLQPRDRSRAASQAQIDAVARNMNADVLVTDFHRIDSGSPIIDKDGNVLSGNGRTLALQRAADLNPDQYAAYKARMKEEAARLGIDPRAIDGMQNPVLVRELKGDTDTVAFAREANSSGTLRMSPLEQAKVDAQTIADRSVLKLNVRDDQGIDQALRDPANKRFIDDFLATVPDNERATLLTRDGNLNQMGLYRAKAALYTKAFDGEAGSRLAESMLESLDPDVRTIQTGISASLPNISRTTAMIRNGDRDKDLDLSEDFARTIDVYARIKDNPAMTANTPANRLIDKYLNQQQMFDRELTPDQEILLRHIDSISRKPTAVRDMFNQWAALVDSQPPPRQASLFGGGGMTRRDLINALVGGTGSGSQPVQGGLFS